MEIKIKWGDQVFSVDLHAPIDLTIPLVPNQPGPNCFFAPQLEAAPVRTDTFVGSIDEGAPLNFFNLRINPHGNGTHTECEGHIKSGAHYIGERLASFHFKAQLISLFPEKAENGDRIINSSHLAQHWAVDSEAEALLIRTIPNSDDKKNRIYSGTNPPYFRPEAIQYIVDQGIKHLLVDLPSVDREEDGGQLAAHKSFFNFSKKERTERTLSELIFIPDDLKDGNYLLQLTALRLNLDASPSRVVVYELNA
ncbi:MAG: cyclase family protein [Bacteroidetes bacterium]|jgi:kynurenine formamidase|nr:cyclase family protein [Bacteroidota bacterium]